MAYANLALRILTPSPMPAIKKPEWLLRINASSQDFALRHKLNDDSARELRELLALIAKSNYVEGNADGIRWARSAKSALT